jgi:hypothetical protein
MVTLAFLLSRGLVVVAIAAEKVSTTSKKAHPIAATATI